MLKHVYLSHIVLYFMHAVLQTWHSLYLIKLSDLVAFRLPAFELVMSLTAYMWYSVILFQALNLVCLKLQYQTDICVERYMTPLILQLLTLGCCSFRSFYHKFLFWGCWDRMMGESYEQWCLCGEFLKNHYISLNWHWLKPYDYSLRRLVSSAKSISKRCRQIKRESDWNEESYSSFGKAGNLGLGKFRPIIFFCNKKENVQCKTALCYFKSEDCLVTFLKIKSGS